jgi:hypothetical protein
MKLVARIFIGPIASTEYFDIHSQGARPAASTFVSFVREQAGLQ